MLLKPLFLFRRIRVAFFGVLLSVNCAQADPPTSFDVWPVEDANAPSTITSILQAGNGYLWMGSYNGLARYDGARFVLFDSANTPGLRNSRVTSLYESRSGILWIGHETGQVTKFANGEFQPFIFNGVWPGGAVESINTDDNDDLWLGNDRGFLFRPRDGKTIECPGAGSATRKVQLAPGQTGKLWICANGSVARLDQGTLVPFNFGDTNGSFYQALIPARTGGLWVLVNGHLRRWQNSQWTLDLGECPAAQDSVTLLFESRDGNVLAGTLRDGIYLMTPGGSTQHFNRTNGLTHDWVRSLCEDHEGNIWIGTGGGLHSLRPRKVQMLNSPDSWRGRAVLSLAATSEADAWIGTEGAGLYSLRNGHWRSFVETNGLKNPFVWSLVKSRADELYVGTWGGGLFLMDHDQFTSPGDVAKISAPVVSLLQGKGDEIWVGTTEGILRLENHKITWSAGKEKLFLPDVRAMANGPGDTVYFGMSGGGLGVLTNGVLKQFRRTDGLSSDFIQCLYSDPEGTLWIGTSDNGLCRLKNGKFSNIGTAQGLPTTILSHIVEDNDHNLWIGSHHGILRAPKAELERCADRQATTVRFLNYEKSEGLASLICSGGFQPGACLTSSGRIWFPTTKGVAIIDPTDVSTNTAKPPVVIEDFLADGAPVASPPWPNEMRVSPGKQVFVIHYTGLSFSAPEKVLFKYRLENLQKSWTDAGNRRSADYSYLPPGKYRFQVEACNKDGVWNEEGATIAFVVLPWFYQTWWFLVLALLAGAALVAGAVVWITRSRVRRKMELLERQRALERERARIARDIHDDLGASLTRITMLSQTVRGEVHGEPQTMADVDQIYQTARELTRAMDEIVWAVNPKHDTLDSLATYLGRFAQDFLSVASLRCRLDVPLTPPPWTLTSEIRHNVFLAFKEALNNVVKHARASEVRVTLEIVPGKFTLSVADNGQGFDSTLLPESGRIENGLGGEKVLKARNGNGLVNMRKRLEEIGGECQWQTMPGEGTRVKLVVPLDTAPRFSI